VGRGATSRAGHRTPQGGLPRRALALVLEWASPHWEELQEDWERARQGLPLAPIAPLD